MPGLGREGKSGLRAKADLERGHATERVRHEPDLLIEAIDPMSSDVRKASKNNDLKSTVADCQKRIGKESSQTAGNRRSNSMRGTKVS